MLERWKELAREVVGSFRIFDILRLSSRSPRTGKDCEFFTIDCCDWVNVIAFDEEGQLVLVRQFRHGPGDFTLEIPGGAVHRGEDPHVAGLRELREESGYEVGESRLIGSANPNPAIFTNQCATVLATGCRRVGDPEPDPGEDLEVVTMTESEVHDAIRRGDVNHALVLAAFTWLALDRSR